MTGHATQVIETAGLKKEQIDRLKTPLDPSLVQVNTFDRSKPDFEYLTHDDVIKQANEIFGYDNWGYTVIGDVSLYTTSAGEPFYRALVEVTVMGVPPRQGVGIWAVQRNKDTGRESVAAHATAAAGAVTSGLKRAFRNFGSQFGLDLSSSRRRDRSGGHAQNRARQTGQHVAGKTRRPPICGRSSCLGSPNRWYSIQSATERFTLANRGTSAPRQALTGTTPTPAGSGSAESQ